MSLELVISAISSILIVVLLSYFYSVINDMQINDKLIVLIIAHLHNSSSGDFEIIYKARGFLDTTNGLSINNYTINYSHFNPTKCNFNKLLITNNEIRCLTN